jgi:hypothetical protein
MTLYHALGVNESHLGCHYYDIVLCVLRPEAKQTVKNAIFNTIYEHQMTAWFALKKNDV